MSISRSSFVPWKMGSAVVLAAIALVAMPAPVTAAENTPVTFAKDVAPIFQAKCQACHRLGSMAPMSLVTYEETRPWAKSIKQRVERREMPPWHLDRTVGIQKFKNDRSLSDEQIDTIVKWVDAGAPLGNPKDLPPPVQWPDGDTWTIGKPELIVTTPEHKMYANGADWWGNYLVDPNLTEDRYMKAVETKPSKLGRRVVHHTGTSLVTDDRSGAGGETSLSEFAVGKYGDVYPEGTGRLLKAGSKINFNLHLFAVGQEVPAQVSVGYLLYPKGYVPKYKVSAFNMGSTNGHPGYDIDIPPNSVTRHDAYVRLEKAARIISYQPHMHMRGKAMTMEAIYPSGQVETLSAVDRFDFRWHVAYVYDDDVAPLLPAGTMLHTIAIHDNTAANRNNPDLNMQVVFGQRSIDDMNQCHVLFIYLDNDDYQRQLAERKAKQLSLSDQQQ